MCDLPTQAHDISGGVQVTPKHESMQIQMYKIPSCDMILCIVAGQLATSTVSGVNLAADFAAQHNYCTFQTESKMFRSKGVCLVAAHVHRSQTMCFAFTNFTQILICHQPLSNL